MNLPLPACQSCAVGIDMGKVIGRLLHSSKQSCIFLKTGVQHAVERINGKRRQIEARLRPIPAVQLIVRTVQGLGAHDGSHMAAGVAYYTILSLFPLTLGVIAVLGFFLPSENVQEELFDFFEKNLPGYVDELESNISSIIRLRGALGLLSIIGLFWSASAVFGGVSRAVNRAFGIYQDRPFLKRKLRDLTMALGVGLLVLLSLGMSSVSTILRGADIAAVGIAADLGGRFIALLLNVGIFLLLYKFIPNTQTSWRYVWPGAVLAAILFEIAKSFFILYLTHFSNYEAVYGSVGSIIALLVWIYFCALITVLGAEFSSAYGHMRQGISQGASLAVASSLEHGGTQGQSMRMAGRWAQRASSQEQDRVSSLEKHEP